jgi:hypothetical protein
MLPLAPVLLSTVMPWPVLAAIFWAIKRPTTSTEEPAEKGLISTTGRVGQSVFWACATSARLAHARPVAALARRVRAGGQPPMGLRAVHGVSFRVVDRGTGFQWPASAANTSAVLRVRPMRGKVNFKVLAWASAEGLAIASDTNTWW